MTDNTKRILNNIARQNGTTPEEVEHEIMEAIREAMGSPDPHAQALWKQICPDGKVPDLDRFLTVMANLVGKRRDIQKAGNGDKRFFS